METQATVYTTDTADARKVGIRAMERTSKGWSIAALRKELSDCSVTITSLAIALDSAREELAAIRAHCYGPGNESAMDQVLARAKAAETERDAMKRRAEAAESDWQVALAEAEHLRVELAAWKAMPHPTEVFTCRECGPGVWADEDGCCATCGRGCQVTPWAEALATISA